MQINIAPHFNGLGIELPKAIQFHDSSINELLIGEGVIAIGEGHGGEPKVINIFEHDIYWHFTIC